MGRKQRSKGTGTIYKRGGSGPWIACYWDHKGKRKEHSCRTTDRQAAERILNKLVADVALRRDFVIDPIEDDYAAAGRRPLAEHVDEYLAYCANLGQDARHISQKRGHLSELLNAIGATRLSHLNADALARHLSTLVDGGLSARTVNYVRQTCVAFGNWCVKTGRLANNQLRIVPKRDEARDRRRVRRPLTDAELAGLVEVSKERGRDAWYLAAALAGLRKGDLQRLTWADVNFAEATVTIRGGKARRIDVIPMHEQLAESLQRRYRAQPALPTARVWPDTVTDLTRMKDFLRAGIARKVDVLDSKGKPVIIKNRLGERVKTKIVVEDSEGRVIDLHAMRTTLGTNLARAGVAPQVAQRIMRHGDYKTTLKHYTVLGLADTSAAVARLPSVSIAGRDAIAATGTDGTLQKQPQLYSQQLGREKGKTGAIQRDELSSVQAIAKSENSRKSPGNTQESAGNSRKRAKGFEPSTFSLEG
ncbi:MAG: site-specific integrase [Planctomycetes bacterium]|nr:site-specific integrase [Planctomycetota bacterium]